MPTNSGTARSMKKKKILIALGCLALVPVLAIAALVAIREPPDGPRVEAAPGVIGVEAGGAYAWIVKTSHGWSIPAWMPAGPPFPRS